MHDIIGLVGALIIVSFYLMLQINKIDSKGIFFSISNILGFFLVIISIFEN